MDWSYDRLWEKAKLFAQRAHDQDRDDPLFPLWSVLCLEILSRATLAKVHPALLADPSEGENILYAFSYATTKAPKSVSAKTVFERCKRIVADFTDREYDHCLNLIERRNIELHSGAAAFEDFPTRLWLSDYYRVCQILLKAQEKTLGDLLAAEDAAMAEDMISTDYRKVQEAVKQIIRLSKDDFYRRSEEEQAALRAKAADNSKKGNLAQGHQTVTPCPACKSPSIVSGKRTRTSEPFLDGDYIARRTVILPVTLKCEACGLSLDGYEKLQAANLGGHITETEYYEPMEYYDFDPADYFEPDYGND